MGEAALALNPYDADMSGFLGLFKLACGQADEGEALLRRSLQLDASYTGVPAVTLAFVLSQRAALADVEAWPRTVKREAAPSAPADKARNIDRKSVVQGKSGSVRVDLGGLGLIKKKTMKRKEETCSSAH